jgi:hypothetical protein
LFFLEAPSDGFVDAHGNIGRHVARGMSVEGSKAVSTEPGERTGFVITLDRLRYPYTREELLWCLTRRSASKIGPEYQPGEETYASLARITVSSYGVNNSFLKTLFLETSCLARWCRAEGLIPHSSWVNSVEDATMARKIDRHEVLDEPVNHILPRPALRKADATLMLRDWYKIRVRDWPADQVPPSGEADEQAARAAFPHLRGLRDLVRARRIEIAPEEWRKQGRRKNPQKNNLAANMPN